MTVWGTIRSGFSAFTATARDTFGCAGNNGNAIDDDDDNNYVADNNGKGESSQPSFVEVDLLRSDLNRSRKYPDNSIRTAKYTLVSGLPLSLLYQFYKISNFYFLLVMIVTLIPGASPINPFSSVVPLCVVLGAGIVKDLWEDWKRRKADQQANEMLVHVLRVPMQSDEKKRRRVHCEDAAKATSTTTTTTATTAATAATTSNAGDSGNNDSNSSPLPRAETSVPEERSSSSNISSSGGKNSKIPSHLSNDNNKDGVNQNSNASDRGERNDSNALVDSSSSGAAAIPAKEEQMTKERKRRRMVHFLFPSEKSRSKSSVQPGEDSASPRRSVEMASYERNSRASMNEGESAAAVPTAELATKTTATVAPPSAPTRSALLKKQTEEDKQPASAAAAPPPSAPVAEAPPSTTFTSSSGEPKVTFQPIRSCDVYPGDIMLFRLGEEVKADCVILNTSLPDGLTYIETANLDGETNAKTRRAKIQTVEKLGTVEDIIEHSLGVPASNAAAVFAKMNGVDLTNGATFTAATAPAKVMVNSCGAVGAHVVMSPSQEADRALAAAASAQNIVVMSGASELNGAPRRTTPLRPAKNEKEKRRLLSYTTSSTSDTEGQDGTTMKEQTVVRERYTAFSAGNSHNNTPNRTRSGTRDGEGAHAFAASHLEREEREAAEAGMNDVSWHQRSFSDQTAQLQPHHAANSNGHQRTSLPLIMSGADLSCPSASDTFFGPGGMSANGTPGDVALDRVRHQRHLTLDERLMEEGAIPVPQHLRELSAQYDRAVLRRASSLGAHTAAPSVHLRRAETSVIEDADSLCIDGDNGGPQRQRRASSLRTPSAGERTYGANSAKTTVRNSERVSGGGITPAESSHYNRNSRTNNDGAADDDADMKDGAASTTSLSAAAGVVLVSCAPTPDLSTWFGQLRMPTGEIVALGIDQFIPRGCLIRNTDWVLGAVVYTGRHTKMLLNLRPKPNKITSMARRLNQLNAFLFVLNQSFMFLLCGLSIWSKHYFMRQLPNSKSEFSMWYIQWSLTRYSDATLFWWRYLTNFVLLSYLIPMSLYVTLEFNKAMQMLLIGADNRMAVFDEFTGAIKKARPKTSELNSQLGHVRYIFTDKTGTLTENLMTYVGGVVGGQLHNETEQPGGIGRALLKRQYINAGCRLLSTSGEDVRHGAAGLSGVGFNNLDGSVTGSVPSRPLLPPPAAGLNQSTTPADGGEAPNASVPAAGAGAPSSTTALNLAAANYQVPSVFANTKAPPASASASASAAVSATAGGTTGAAGSIPCPRSSGALMPSTRAGALSSYRHPSSVADSPSLPNFGTPATPFLSDHAHVGSGVGLPTPGTGLLHGVASGILGGVGSYSGAFASTSGGPGAASSRAAAFGGSGGGLSGISEAVLERDPLFRYLRALALCHSIVCFPVQEQSTTGTSDSGESDLQHGTVGEVEGLQEVDETPMSAKAMRKQRKAERKAMKKARGTHKDSHSEKDLQQGDDSQRHRSREEKEEEEAQQATEAKEKARKHKEHRHLQHHHHHDKKSAAEGKDAKRTEDVHENAYDAPRRQQQQQQQQSTRAHSRHASSVAVPPVSRVLSLSNISAANFVEIPYAVPAGPSRNDFEPYSYSSAPDQYHSMTDLTAAAAAAVADDNDRNEPITAASSTALASRAAHGHTTSSTSFTSSPQVPQPVPPLPNATDAGDSAFQLSPRTMSKLHGRTSSASWYQNRYLNRLMHSRNWSQNSNVSLRRCGATGGGPGSPWTGAHSRGSMSPNGAKGAGDGGSACGDGGGGGNNNNNINGGLEQYIDRTKIYEGQSLDEIALVNAARENGFSLFERTAKQMYVKALGRIFCYDIIAELEFTPQRKLMSILLQRRPELDSEDAAGSAAAGKSSHFHRKKEEELAAEQQQQQQAAAEAATLLCNGSSTNANNNNTGVSSFFQAPQARAAHASFTPDLAAVGNSMNELDDVHGKDVDASSLQLSMTDSPYPAGPRRLAPKPIILTPLRSVDVSANSLGAGGPHVSHSASVFAASAPTPTGPQQPQSSVNEVSALRPIASGASPGSSALGPRKYLLLVKGADSSMMEIVNMQKKANARVKEKMLSELDAMAKLGLRTLVLGQRYLSEEEVLAWLPIFNEAQCAMQDRNEKLHSAYALLEKDVDIVGTTAVEDKLQDEVPQTLEFCIQAMIVVWMLTGDKRETAVTIAHTSGLVSSDYTDYVCHLDVSDLVEEEMLLKQQQQYEERTRARKAIGEADDDDDDEEEDTSVPRSQASGQPSNGNQNNNNTVGSTPLPNSSSSATRSPGLLSVRTAAGDGDGGLHRSTETSAAVTEGAPLMVGVGVEGKKCSTAAATTRAAVKTTITPVGESFLERKTARIEAQLAAAETKCSEGVEIFGTHTIVIVVDGKTLDFIFENNARAHRFFLLGSRCRSAVCCRMTPLQKAKIVRMFKRNMNAVALAIGDGANDVSMIQESSIGVGIMGLEGSQAELASDYAIPKFRFLKRLLFVHGRFSVFRDAHCIVFSLYKNVIVTVGMIAYQFYSGYSGQALMDSWLLAIFNIFCCSLQPLMIGILDKDVEDELAESLPKLYPPLSREFMYFSFPYIIKWLLDGLVEGLIFFFVLMYTVGVQDNLYSHMTPAIEDYGTTFFTMLVLVADFRVATLVTYYMALFAVAIFLEIIFVPIIEVVYSSINNMAGSNWCVKVAHELLGHSGKYWMMLFFAVGVLVVITMASNMYIQLFYPWQNAGFAMRSAWKSSHRVPYERMKKELKEEYAYLLARYEELRQKQERQQSPNDDEVRGGAEGGATPADSLAMKKGTCDVNPAGGEAAKLSA